MSNAGKVKSKQSQNVLIKIVKTPVRVLCKARDFYVRSIIRCSDGSAYRHTTVGGHYALPKSFSTTSTRSSQFESEDFRELLRAASARGYGHKNELEMYLQQMKVSMASPQSTESKPFPKSVSVGMRFMGRIDEDSSCDQFEEEGGDFKKKEIYPRSKSVAVAKRTSVI